MSDEKLFNLVLSQDKNTMTKIKVFVSRLRSRKLGNMQRKIKQVKQIIKKHYFQNTDEAQNNHKKLF